MFRLVQLSFRRTFGLIVQQFNLTQGLSRMTAKTQVELWHCRESIPGPKVRRLENTWGLT
jgi:ABC-type lipoprotein export system ATPase subunit